MSAVLSDILSSFFLLGVKYILQLLQNNGRLLAHWPYDQQKIREMQHTQYLPVQWFRKIKRFCSVKQVMNVYGN
jgi:hypothetical protein